MTGSVGGELKMKPSPGGRSPTGSMRATRSRNSLSAWAISTLASREPTQWCVPSPKLRMSPPTVNWRSLLPMKRSWSKRSGSAKWPSSQLPDALIDSTFSPGCTRTPASSDSCRAVRTKALTGGYSRSASALKADSASGSR